MATKPAAAARPRDRTEPGLLVRLCLAAWMVPGAGHVWMGRRQKALVFFLALTSMFLIGLRLHGRIFPFDVSAPLVALAAVADLGLGLPWLLARLLDAGNGLVWGCTQRTPTIRTSPATSGPSHGGSGLVDIAKGRK